MPEEFYRWAALLISAASMIVAVWIARGRAAKQDADELGKRLRAVENKTERYGTVTDRMNEIERKRSSDLETAHNALEDARHRLGDLEHQMKHVPSQREVHDLSKSIESIHGDVRVLHSDIKPLAASVTRMEDFLVGGGKGNRS